MTSPALIDELREVLTRSHQAPRLAEKKSSAAQAIDFDSQLAIHVPPLATPQVVAADVDDAHVIAAAIAATADVLDSGDAVLLSLRSYASQ